MSNYINVFKNQDFHHKEKKLKVNKTYNSKLKLEILVYELRCVLLFKIYIS